MTLPWFQKLGAFSRIGVAMFLEAALCRLLGALLRGSTVCCLAESMVMGVIVTGYDGANIEDER